MPATTSHPLLLEELTIYATNWQKIIHENDMPKLRECFTTKDGKLMNYLYLPLTYAKDLIYNKLTAWIMSAYVAVPSDGQTVFSTVLFGIDGKGNPTSGCYLAGARPLPAMVVESDYNFERISNKDADKAIRAWEAVRVNTLSVDIFTTKVEVSHVYKKEVLRGYRHDVDDFKNILKNAGGDNAGGDKAVCLDFALHTPTDSTSPMFGTVVRLQSLPADGESGTIDTNMNTNEDPFYDMSKPCPPFCYATTD